MYWANWHYDNASRELEGLAFRLASEVVPTGRVRWPIAFRR